MRIYLLILIVVLGISCNNQSNKKKESTAKTSTKEATPDFKVAIKFINEYVDICNPKDKVIDELIWIERNPLLTKKFKSTFKNLIEAAYKDEPEVGLDFDPIFDGNDFPEKGFEILEKNDQTGYIKLRGINQPEYTLTMKIVKLNNVWLVDGSGIINIPKDKQAKR